MMMKYYIAGVIGILLGGGFVYANNNGAWLETPPEREELWELRSCSLRTHEQYNRTFHGQLGDWDKICGLDKTCDKDCRYLPDSCRTEYFCYTPRPTTGGGLNNPVEENMKLKNDLLRKCLSGDCPGGININFNNEKGEDN